MNNNSDNDSDILTDEDDVCIIMKKIIQKYIKIKIMLRITK